MCVVTEREYTCVQATTRWVWRSEVSSISYFSVSGIKPHGNGNFQKEESVSGSRGRQKWWWDTAASVGAMVGVGHWEVGSSTVNTKPERTGGWLGLWDPKPSPVAQPFARPHLLILPWPTTNWRRSVWIQGLVLLGDILISATTLIGIGAELGTIVIGLATVRTMTFWDILSPYKVTFLTSWSFFLRKPYLSPASHIHSGLHDRNHESQQLE